MTLPCRIAVFKNLFTLLFEDQDLTCIEVSSVPVDTFVTGALLAYIVLRGLISDLGFFFVRQGLDKQVPEIKIFSFYSFYNADCFIFAFCVCVFSHLVHGLV